MTQPAASEILLNPYNMVTIYQYVNTTSTLMADVLNGQLLFEKLIVTLECIVNGGGKTCHHVLPVRKI